MNATLYQLSYKPDLGSFYQISPLKNKQVNPYNHIMDSFWRRLGSFFLDTIQTIVLALAIFTISYLFLFQPHQVKGTSMYPNFDNNEFLLTDKITYHFRDPKRGEVVIFRAPPSEPCAAEECEYIKRVVGLPNETITIEDGVVAINNQPLAENYLPPRLKTEGGVFLSVGKSLVLQSNQYLLLGDNRPLSRDGRMFGPIYRQAIIGRALLRYWPISKTGFIK